jgi:hypothetical protein
MAVNFAVGVARGIRLAHMLKRKNHPSDSLGKMPFHIRSERGAHSVSNRPVAYLKGARLERKQGTAEGEKTEDLAGSLIIRLERSPCRQLSPQSALDRERKNGALTAGLRFAPRAYSVKEARYHTRDAA